MSGVGKFPFVCKNLLKGELTPLQKREIDDFLKLASQPQDDSASANEMHDEDLKRRRQLIKEHWKEVFGEATLKAFLFGTMDILEIALSRELWADYMNQPLLVAPGVVNMARRHALDGPIKELMLERHHAEHRLRLAVERDGRPGNNIEKLAAKGRWRELASLLLGDRIFIGQLFESEYHRQFNRSLVSIENKYFIELVSESKFTLRASDARRSEKPSTPVEEDRRPLLGRMSTQSVSSLSVDTLMTALDEAEDEKNLL